jgi:hypothetical protein
MISQKYQSKWLVENANLGLVKSACPSHSGQVQNDLSKMIERFFLCLSKMGIFWQNFIVKKVGILIVVVFGGWFWNPIDVAIGVGALVLSKQ